MSHPVPLNEPMTSPRLPARRSFLRFLGALVAVPAVGGAVGPNPDLEDDRERWLHEWADLPRIPVCRPEGPVVRELLAHARQGRPMALFYQGGSRPGCLRRFSPELVFRHERGRHTYVSGFCHQREAPRILRIDRIGLA